MITGGTPIPGNLHIDGFPIEMPCIGADDTRGSQLAPGVAEAGVVPAAVPCFKSNEPPLGSINGWYSWWLNNDIMIINGIYNGINKRAK